MLRRFASLGVLGLAALVVALAQGRGGANWTTAGNDAQRSSWVRADAKISVPRLREPGFQLLWKIPLAGRLTPMVILDPYTGYRGHKSLGYLAGSGGDIYGIDTDLGLVEWHNRLASAIRPEAGGSAGCPGGLTSPPARPTSAAIPQASAGRGGAVRAGIARGAAGEPGQGAPMPQPAPAAPAPARPAGPLPAAAARTLPAVTRPNAVYAVAADGMLQILYVSNGSDAEPAAQFLPPGAHASGLIVVDNVAYAQTTGSCGGTPDGVWAFDLIRRQTTAWNPGRIPGPGGDGPAFGPDGTLYAAAGARLTALEPKTLKPRNSFAEGTVEFASSPVVFSLGGQVLVAAARRDGSVLVLDAATLAQVAAAPPGASAPADASASLSTWEDASNTRWLLASASGQVAAWKVAARPGGTALEPGWVARGLDRPGTPVVVNGVVFVLAAGRVLHALDGVSGNELWSSGNALPAAMRGGAVSAGSGQIYVSGDDGTLCAFGFPMEH